MTIAQYVFAHKCFLDKIVIISMCDIFPLTFNQNMWWKLYHCAFSRNVRRVDYHGTIQLDNENGQVRLEAELGSFLNIARYKNKQKTFNIYMNAKITKKSSAICETYKPTVFQN